MPATSGKPQVDIWAIRRTFENSSLWEAGREVTIGPRGWKLDHSLRATRVFRRVFAVAAILALALLATHAVAHLHEHASDEDHCQVCHVGHAAIPQVAAQVVEQAGARTSRLVLAEELAPRIDFSGTPSIPRAPPA